MSLAKNMYRMSPPGVKENPKLKQTKRNCLRFFHGFFMFCDELKKWEDSVTTYTIHIHSLSIYYNT